MQTFSPLSDIISDLGYSSELSKPGFLPTIGRFISKLHPSDSVFTPKFINGKLRQVKSYHAYDSRVRNSIDLFFNLNPSQRSSLQPKLSTQSKSPIPSITLCTASDIARNLGYKVDYAPGQSYGPQLGKFLVAQGLKPESTSLRSVNGKLRPTNLFHPHDSRVINAIDTFYAELG